MVSIVKYVMEESKATSFYDLQVNDFKSRDLVQALGGHKSVFWEAIAFGVEDSDSVLPWKFNKWPQREPEMVRRALRWLEGEAIRRGWSEEFGPDAWLTISGPRLDELADDEVNGAKLKGMISGKFGGSLIRAAKFLYPKHKYIEIEFATTPNHVIRNDEQVRLYLLKFGKERGWTKPEHWYKLTSTSFDGTAGRGLFAERFKDSPFCVCRWLFPEYEWKFWKMSGQAPKSIWKSPLEQRAFLDYVMEEEGMGSPLDFLKIARKDEDGESEPLEDFLAKYGGGSFSQLSGFTHLYDAFLVNFPEYEWGPWMFGNTRKFWDYYGNRRWFFEWLCSTIPIDIENQEELYTLTVNDIRNHGGRGLQNLMGGIEKAIIDAFQEFEWDTGRLRKAGTSGMFGRKQNQKRLEILVRRLFPHREIQPDYKQQQLRGDPEFTEDRYPLIVNPDTGYELELDVFVPDLRLAYEYQGKGTHESDEVKKRDAEKRKQCEGLGITLIVVPAEWGATLEYVRDITEKHDIEIEIEMDN